MAQYKKTVTIDSRAYKELHKFPKKVQNKFIALIDILSKDGKLEPPDAKKISKDIFEIRVKKEGAWRGFYSPSKRKILITHFIRKKTQKTPKRDIDLAIKRAKQYI
jgi:phage-related protein